MAFNAEDEEESLQDNFFKQRLKYMGAGGFSRVRDFGNVTWDKRRPAHHSRWTDTGGENFFKIERYSNNHRPVPSSEGSVYNAKSLHCNADKAQFSEDRKRHASPVTRHNENSNIYEYNQSAERDVGADSSKFTRQRHLSRWKGKGSSTRKIKEMSKKHEHDRSTDKEEKKWEKTSPRQRLVGVLNCDQSSEIKRRKLDKDHKDQTQFSYSRKYSRNLKPEQIGKNNAQHYNRDIEIGKNCRIVIEFEGLSKEKVVVKRTDGKEAFNSDSQLENKIKNSTVGMLDSNPHDPLRAKDETVSICEKVENNTISVENAKSLTGIPNSEKEPSSTSLLDLTSVIQKTTAHSVQKNVEIESYSQIEEQSSFCVVKDQDKVQLSKDKPNFSHASNMTQLTAEDDRIADLDDVTEKSCTVSNPIGMDIDSHQKNINDSQGKVVVISPNSDTKEHSDKNKVSIAKLGKSELGERDKIIEQNSHEKDQISCIEFSGAKQLKRRKSDETFNRSKHNLLNKGFMSNVNSSESKTTDTIINKNQGNLFDSLHNFTLPFKSSQRRHFDLSEKERKKSLDEHNDNHRKCEAICFNGARSTTIGHSQEKSRAKMDGKKTNLLYSGKKTKICIENTVDKTNMDSSSTKTETNENNEIEDDEQHPKHENCSESNAIADRSFNDLRDLNIDKQRHIQHKEVKVNHKHLKFTLKSKKLKSAKQTLRISSKLFKKVNTPSKMEVINGKKRESCKSKKSQEENKKRINPTRKIRPSYISGSDKENVDVKRTDNVHSNGQDKLIEEYMQIQPVKKVNLDVENVTLNKEINLLQGSKVLEAVQAKEFRQNRNLKVDNIENDDEEEDYTIIDLNIAPATPCPMTPGLSTEVVASLQEYEDCEMDKEQSSGLTPVSVVNMQTPATKIKGHAAYLLQFLYNPDISDISEDDNGDQHSSTQNSHKDEVKEELQEDAIKTKFKRQQPNKEERRMRMERLEEAYMQLTVDAANGKGKKRSVSKKKRKDKEQHHKTKQKTTSDISISLDKTPSKRKSKNSKSKTLSADNDGKCLRNDELANTPDEIKNSLMSSHLIDLSKDEKSVTEVVVANSLISQEASEIHQRKDKDSLDTENEDSSKNLNDLFSHHCINTSEKVVNDVRNITELAVANSLISQEAREIQNRKDKGFLDAANEDSSKNLNDLFLQHCSNTSEKVVNDMKNIDNSETRVESFESRHSPEKAAVSDLKATQNYSDQSTDEAKSITAAERSDALAHHQIWQNGFEFVHDLILLDGRKITTKGHIEPKLMNEKEKNIIRCQVCEKYMTPRSFMYHHDNSNIIKQIDIMRSIMNSPKPDPEDIIIWNSGAGDIWESFLKEISIVDQFGKERHTTRTNYEMRNLQAAGLCSGSSTNTIMVGENIQLPFGDDQRLVSMGNAVDNLQISSSYARGFTALPAATLKYSSGSAKRCQIVSEQAQEKRLRDRSENSHLCRLLTNKSGLTVHHLSDNNFSCTSEPNASVGIVQDAHNCSLQGRIYLQASGSEEPMKRESSLISIRHEQVQNQLKIDSLQTNILALLGKSTNNSLNTATSALDGRGELRNNPTRQLVEDAVAACAEKQQLHGDAYGQQDISDTHTYGQYAVGPDFVVSQARNCHQVANDQIKRVTVSSYSCPHRSVPSPKEKNDCAPSPVEMRVYNVLSVSHDDKFGNQNGETPIHSSNLLYNHPPVTNTKLAISSASCTMVGNESVPLKNISSLNNVKSELHLMANKQLSVSSASKENFMGFATGFETSRDQIASSEPQGTPSVGISSTNQSSSEEASGGNVNTKQSEPKAGPSNLPATASAKTICALDKLIDEIDFQNVADLEPILMLAKKLEIKCMHEMLARSRKNQALVAELTSTVQRLASHK